MSCAVCVPITVRRASSRSAKTPANSPNSMYGRNCANAITPTSNAECVSWRMNQPRAIRCIHEPVWETICPPKKRR